MALTSIEMEINYKDEVLKHWPLLDHTARKRFADENLASEALLFTMGQMEKDNWKRFHAFDSGRASFKTFLMVVTRRLFEDFRKKKFGSVRPPRWLLAFGPLWLKVWRLLCLERMELPDTIETLTAMAPQKYTSEDIEEAGLTIKGRIVHCGHQKGQTVTSDPGELDSIGSDKEECSSDSEGQAIKNEQKHLLAAITHHLFGDNNDNSIPHGSITSVQAQKAYQALGKVKVSSQELLLLRMVYQDGLNLTAAGRLLGLGPNQVHGKSRRLITKLRTALEDAEVNFEDGV